MSSLVVVIVLVVFALVFVFATVKIVPQAQVLIIERLGSFNRVAESGLNFIIPFFDKPRAFRNENGRFVNAIDLREQVIDFEPQPVITKDNVTMLVDSVIYVRIMDPRRAIYEIEDLYTAIRQLAITSFRNVIGELELDETLSSRDVINNRLQRVLDEATNVWGVKVTRVELKNIQPPMEIEQSMSRQMKAERERRALVTEAEGHRSALILRAQGERDAAIAEAEGRRSAAILDAQGQAQAILEVAKAKAESVRMEFASIHDGQATPEVLTLRYLESLKEIANGQATKVFFPIEATGIVGALGQIADVMRPDTAQPAPSSARPPEVAGRPPMPPRY